MEEVVCPYCNEECRIHGTGWFTCWNCGGRFHYGGYGKKTGQNPFQSLRMPGEDAYEKLEGFIGKLMGF